MKDKDQGMESYEDFLSHLSRFASKDEEEAFMDSLGRGPEDEDIAIRVGERVKRVREQRGLSLLDISQRTGIDVPILRDIEEGLMAPPLGTVIKLAKALEMKMCKT